MPEDRAERKRTLLVVDDALTRLSVEHRAVIVCAFYRGMSTREIADELGIPEETVKSRMHHGMRALRAALNGEGVGT